MIFRNFLYQELLIVTLIAWIQPILGFFNYPVYFSQPSLRFTDDIAFRKLFDSDPRKSNVGSDFSIVQPVLVAESNLLVVDQKEIIKNEGHEKFWGYLEKKVKETNKYKEESRLYRRTVYQNEDWLQFRSSGRYYKSLMSMFNSGVIKGLWVEIFSVALLSLIVFVVNKMILLGFFMPYVTPEFSSMLTLPVLPFQLVSPALGLLLVFRNNTVYTRWRTADQMWDRIRSMLLNCCRQGVAYFDVKYKV